MGVAKVFTPGATTQSIVDWVRAAPGRTAATITTATAEIAAAAGDKRAAQARFDAATGGFSIPARTAVVLSAAGSEPAPGGGSVMQKQDRISAEASGRNQRSFCSGVATTSIMCMLPSSGAEMFMASGPSTEYPASSNTTALPTWLKPRPPNSSDTCGASNPAAFRRDCRSTGAMCDRRSNPVRPWTRMPARLASLSSSIPRPSAPARASPRTVRRWPNSASTSASDAP